MDVCVCVRAPVRVSVRVVVSWWSRVRVSVRVVVSCTRECPRGGLEGRLSVIV